MQKNRSALGKPLRDLIEGRLSSANARTGRGLFMCRLITLVHGAQKGRTSAAMRPTRPLLDGRAQPRGLGVAPIWRNVVKDQREALNDPN